MPARRKSTPAKDSTANLGFEAKLWLAADKLRNNMDAAEYKHVVLATIDLVASNQPSPQPSPSGRGSKSDELPSTSGRGVGGERCLRDRRRETLFIDARKMGTLIDRVHRELTDEDLEKITDTYHAWRGDSSTDHRSLGTDHSASPPYSNVPGFCYSATTAEIAAHGHVLTPGRYVGAEEVEDDGDPFEEKMPRLVAELHAHFVASADLEAAIRKNLQGLGYAP